MSWRTAATIIIVIAAVVLVQSVLAGPIKQYQDGINASGDYNNQYFDGEALIQQTVSSWFDMGLVVVFGIGAWGVARVVRRELTRGGRP